MLNLLKELCQLPAPVGRERLVQLRIKEELNEIATKNLFDLVGNQIFYIGEKRTRKSSIVAVIAHCDEISFVVDEILPSGLIRVIPNYASRRSPDTRILPFQEVILLKDDYSILNGPFFAIDTGHVVESSIRDKRPKMTDLYIDVGASTKEVVEKQGIHPGTPVIWKSPFIKQKNLISCKAMDDRLGLATMIEAAKNLAKKQNEYPFLLISSVQEEIGVMGAKALAQLPENIDLAIILEIHPITRISEKIKFGNGPCIVLKDGGIHYDHQFSMEIAQLAEQANIPFQWSVFSTGMTDGSALLTQNKKVALLSCPCAYPHSPKESIDVTDLENLKKLLEITLENIPSIRKKVIP
ncbi:MAG: M42 family metallopeptidase [Promethearchaeota archaeon]